MIVSTDSALSLWRLNALENAVFFQMHLSEEEEKGWEFPLHQSSCDLEIEIKIHSLLFFYTNSD